MTWVEVIGMFSEVLTDCSSHCKADVAVILTDVVCMECGNTPGSLAAILAALAERGIFIEYMYAFSQAETTAKVIIRPNDLKACTQVLSELELA